MKKLTAFSLSLIILLLTPLAASASEATTPTGIPLSEIVSHIDKLVYSYMHEVTPGLAIAIVKDGEIVFMQGYGYSHIDRTVAINPKTTIFEYGSISKLFVWTAVMQLVERGLLDLDVDIHNYLPDDLVRQFNFQYSFTIRDLLNHSAGFGEFSFSTFRDAESLVNPTSLRANLLASQPKQIYTPGTASSYSNFGSALAAYIVGHVEGLEFADFELENILGPLGMENTRNQPHWFGDYTFLQAAARGHLPNGMGGFIETPWVYVPMYPAGALRGTAEDLAKFAIALMPSLDEPSSLFNNRNTLDLLLSPSSNSQALRGTHHGFISYDGVLPSIGHSGATVGFSAEFVLVPSERFGIILLNNSLHGQVMSVELLDLFLGDSMDTVATLVENLPNAESVAGTFVSLRRNVDNILEPWDFMLGTHTEVVAIDSNTITIGGVIYRQIEPFVFRAVATDGTVEARFDARLSYEIHFTVENGQVIGMSRGGSSHSTVQTFSQSMLVFLTSLSILLISTVFFLVMSIITFIRFLRRKDRKANYFGFMSGGLLLTGVLFTINFIVLEGRLIMASRLIQSYMVAPHVWINYILLIISSVLFVISLVLSKRGDATKRKVLHFSTATLLALFIVVLWNWNYFVIM